MLLPVLRVQRSIDFVKQVERSGVASLQGHKKQSHASFTSVWLVSHLLTVCHPHTVMLLCWETGYKEVVEIAILLASGSFKAYLDSEDERKSH